MMCFACYLIVPQYNLGLCYHNGTGVAKDLKKAVQLYQQAADQGHVAAQVAAV